MMKKRYYTILYRLSFFIAAAMTIVVAACVDRDLEDEFDETPIRFSAQQSFSATRAVTTNVQDALFDSGEEINIFLKASADGGETWTEKIYDKNGDEISYPIVYTAQASTGTTNQLTPKAGISKQPYYPLNPVNGSASDVKAEIFAAYPNTVTASTSVFTVQTDQTTKENYKASDLMLVKPFDHAKNKEVVTLPFKHKMAKLIINAIADDGVEIDDVITVSDIYGSVKMDFNNGDLDYGTVGWVDEKSLPIVGDADGKIADDEENPASTTTITMLNGGAVVFPAQYIAQATNFITIKGKDKNRKEQTAQFGILDKTFYEGRVYKLNIHIGSVAFNPNKDGSPHLTVITGWSEDYDELTLTPEKGYRNVSIDDIDGKLILEGSSVSGTCDSDGGAVEEVFNEETPSQSLGNYYVYSKDADNNPIACCPTPKVIYEGDESEGIADIELTAGTDFRYVYVDNKRAGDKAQVMIVGTGSYVGLAALKPYTIRRAKGKISFPEGSDKTSDNAVDYEPDQSIPLVSAINTGDGVVTYSVIADGEDETTDCASVDPVDGIVTMQSIGKCTIKATAVSGRNFDYPEPDNTCTYKVEIKVKKVQKGNLTITYEPHSFTYDGTEKQLTKLVVADGEHTLAEGEDYEYTLTDSLGRYEGLPIHHGTALLTIKGKGNYDKNTKIEIGIPIKQATPTLTVKETDMALGEYRAAAPKDRRKTREATTEEWAQNSIRYSVSATENTKDNDVLTVTDKGLLTGKVLKEEIDDQPVAAKSTTVYVQVAADESTYQDWKASEQKSFKVTVYRSDFTFKIKRYTISPYREKQLHIMSDGVPEGAHTVWNCPAKGDWQIDCYGAQGGDTPKYTTEKVGVRRTTAPAIVDTTYANQGHGGRGAHIAGRINLPKNQVLHVNLGQKGRNIYPGEQRLRWKTQPSGTASALKTGNRGSNGGKVNGDLSTLKAGDYEWAAFAWNGGGGFIWGGRCMIYVTFYNQDNSWVGHEGASALSPLANGTTGSATGSGQSYASFPITGGGGATDVSLAWDDEGGVYTPPTTYTDDDRSSTTQFSYVDNSRTDGTLTFTYDPSVSPKYTRKSGGTFEKWMTAHNMVNREKGVGTKGETGTEEDKKSDANREVGLQWKNPAHLYSRIIVAGGGGGALYYDSNDVFGDGGNGGVWEGTRGLRQDYGEGGYINAGGRGGIWTNWKMGGTRRDDDRTSEWVASSSTTNYPSDLTYNDGGNGGGWTGTDGMFGEGGTTFQPAQGCGGGGGGWYGGGAGNEDYDNGPGGGGSSFMWTDKESLHTYVSSSQVARSAFTNTGINHTVQWGASRLLYQNYDYLDVDYKTYNGFSPEKWHKKASNFYQFMPTNETARSGRGSNLGIECPFFHEVVTKDTGANSGDGWAKITLVEIDEDQPEEATPATPAPPARRRSRAKR